MLNITLNNVKPPCRIPVPQQAFNNHSSMLQPHFPEKETDNLDCGKSRRTIAEKRHTQGVMPDIE